MAGSFSVKFEPDVPLMLRDGTITYADIYRPDQPGRLPALLKRTPSNKSVPASSPSANRLASEPAMSSTACRGMGSGPVGVRR